MTSLRIAGAVALVQALLIGTALTGTAAAAHVGCGQIITQSTVLDADVGPCPDGGIVVGADNITLDLGGRTVRGTPQPGDGVGILLEGRTGVRVMNGTVTSFDAGVAILGGSGNTVTRLRALDNVGSGETDFGDGIAISSSPGNVISRNLVQRNGPFSGIGVFGAPSIGNQIDSNAVQRNNVRLPDAPNQDDGIRLEPGTSRSTVTNNLVEGNGLDGIAVFARSTDNVVRRNAVRGNGFVDIDQRPGSGIILFNQADRNLVEQNSVRDNAANGIVLRGTVTIRTRVIPGAMNNRILRNATGGNGAIAAGEPDNPFFDLRDDNFDPPCDANVWSQNSYRTFNQPCVTGGLSTGAPLAGSASPSTSSQAGQDTVAPEPSTARAAA